MSRETMLCLALLTHSTGLFFVERKYGPVITPAEVRELLAPFGTIDSCYSPQDVERTSLNLNDGVIVQFAMYDDGQNAQSVSLSLTSPLHA